MAVAMEIDELLEIERLRRRTGLKRDEFVVKACKLYVAWLKGEKL